MLWFVFLCTQSTSYSGTEGQSSTGTLATLPRKISDEKESKCQPYVVQSVRMTVYSMCGMFVSTQHIWSSSYTEYELGVKEFRSVENSYDQPMIEVKTESGTMYIEKRDLEDTSEEEEPGRDGSGDMATKPDEDEALSANTTQM